MDLQTLRAEVPSRQPRLTVSMAEGAGSSRTWFVVIIALFLAWVLIPWTAPFLMSSGLESLAKPIYAFYSYQCHQLPQRSFFLFGSSAMISLEEVQATWQDTADPLLLRQYVGNDEIGYKVAWSDRMVSAYSTIPLAGIIWWIFRKKLPFISVWELILLSLPIIIDGATHMVSDLQGIGQGFRYTNAWLAELTHYRYPLFFYQGTTLGSFNSMMRLITGALFGLGAGWFMFPRMALALGLIKPSVRAQIPTTAPKP